jgi:DMSO/TMAO reductase YedYZ heme-binding membrane subunit
MASMTLSRWGSLVIVRRMIEVAALVYSVAHIFIYFALRLSWRVSRPPD